MAKKIKQTYLYLGVAALVIIVAVFLMFSGGRTGKFAGDLTNYVLSNGQWIQVSAPTSSPPPMSFWTGTDWILIDNPPAYSPGEGLIWAYDISVRRWVATSPPPSNAPAPTSAPAPEAATLKLSITGGPAEGATVGGAVTFTWACNEACTTRYGMDGGGFGPWGTKTSATFSGFSDGQHTFGVQAKNADSTYMTDAIYRTFNVVSGCTDSDGGRNLDQQGTCIGLNGTFTDYCTPWGPPLVEYLCTSDGVYCDEAYGSVCPVGTSCSNGACV
jgi:hypothetical protein